MICGSGCSKRRLVRAAGAEVAGSAEKFKKWHAAVARSTCTKHLRGGPLFEVKVQKWHAAVARSIGKSIFEVPMSKNGTLLWREAHLQVKMLKTWGSGGHVEEFRCRKKARRYGARGICKSKCAKHMPCVLARIWRFRCRKAVRQKRYIDWYSVSQ